MAKDKEVGPPPPPCVDSDHEDLPLAERRRRLLRPPAESKPPAPERREASAAAAAAEDSGGAAQQGWPGLPRGVEFNPTDSDLLWHLAAEVGNGQARRHPFINEFIKSVDETIGFGYTHPQDIPGIRQDGCASYFFHKNFKECANENSKCIRWQKSGNPISITLDGNLQGCKEVFVLYAYETDGNNPQITDWRLHQYHIESTEKDEGELVVSKIFYELEKNQFKWAEKSHAQSAQGASAIDDDSKEELQLDNHSFNMITENSSVQGNENKQKQTQTGTCPNLDKLSYFNVVSNMHIGNQINDHDEIEELDHMSLQERYRILMAENHSSSAVVSSEQCAIDGLENSCKPGTNGMIPKRIHEGTAFRDGMYSMLQEISSAPAIIGSIDNDNNRRLLTEGLSNNQQSHEAGCESGFLSTSSSAAPPQCQVVCSHDLLVNGKTLIYSRDPSSSSTPTFGDKNIQLEGTDDRTLLVDIKLEPALEGDFTEKITSSVQRTDPNHGTEGSNLVGSINSVSSAISKRISEAARSNPENSHVEGLLPSSRIKSEVTGSELPLVVCGLTSISIAELTAKKTNTLNHDGGTAYFSRQRRRRKTATDSIETALEEDAPGLLQILLDKGILVKEIKLYGVEEEDDMVPDCTESDFQDLENVITKLFPQRTSLLKSALRHEKGEKAIYCLTCLISLIEQSRYLQFRDCPVEWGWCRDLQSFIFIFKSHNRIVLERPEYGYATYFFEIVKSLPIQWQIQRMVTAMKLSGCGRTALIENRPLLIGEDLTEGEARVLEEYGWVPNSGLGTMLNYRDRVVHDRWNERSGTDWKTKIGKLLMNGYSEGHLVLSHFPTKVGKIEDDTEIKQEDPL
uniref:No apical meristem protein, expressed n=1 Tax=Oryza sativa subsp. japonica TaxID=39947 RepID=Q10PU3_ORYSJ|nr:No apical meristem protein, expressed [Oryza sativa Japonica Group]